MSQARTCQNCKHEARAIEQEPCKSCADDVDFGKWEASPRPWEAPAPEPPPEVVARVAELEATAPDPYHEAKHDLGKLRWDCLPWPAVEQVVRVLTFGAEKYSAWSWPGVPDARRRYFAALIRHAVAWLRGERLDPESGLPHLAHLACNALFLLSFERGEAAEPAALAELAAPPAREP
jgi:hypothetical protein